MQLYLVVPILAFFAVVQSTAVPFIPFAGARPDLVLLIVISWGAISPTRDAVLWGLIGGVFLDLLSGLPFGTQTAALALVGLTTDLLGPDFFRSNILTPLITTFIATLLYYALMLGLLQFVGRDVNWTDWLARVVLPTGLINTLLMPIVYTLMRRLFRGREVELNV